MARNKDEGKDKSGNKKKVRDKSPIKEKKQKTKKKKDKVMKKQKGPENVGEVEDDHLMESQIGNNFLSKVCVNQDISGIFLSKEVKEVREMKDSDIKSFLGKIEVLENLKANLEKKREEHEQSGFQNLGNTCYFNSLMQTLASCYVFKKAVLELDIPKDFYHYT